MLYLIKDRVAINKGSTSEMVGHVVGSSMVTPHDMNYPIMMYVIELDYPWRQARFVVAKPNSLTLEKK